MDVEGGPLRLSVGHISVSWETLLRVEERRLNDLRSHVADRERVPVGQVWVVDCTTSTITLSVQN